MNRDCAEVRLNTDTDTGVPARAAHMPGSRGVPGFLAKGPVKPASTPVAVLRAYGMPLNAGAFDGIKEAASRRAGVGTTEVNDGGTSGSWLRTHSHPVVTGAAVVAAAWKYTSATGRAKGSAKFGSSHGGSRSLTSTVPTRLGRQRRRRDRRTGDRGGAGHVVSPLRVPMRPVSRRRRRVARIRMSHRATQTGRLTANPSGTSGGSRPDRFGPGPRERFGDAPRTSGVSVRGQG